MKRYILCIWLVAGLLLGCGPTVDNPHQVGNGVTGPTMREDNTIGEVDSDSNNDTTVDADGDGHKSIADGGEDNDDNDPTVYPGAPELCSDNKDNDQDGGVNEGCSSADTSDDDSDTFSEADGDCNDGDPAIHPNATEVTGNTVDENCDGIVEDKDGDGFNAEGIGGADCVDTDRDINPDATEIPGNSVDEDCSGSALDQDDDGFDATADGGSDCDDSDETVNPGATEVMDDDTDQDCDGIRGWTFTKIYDDVVNGSCDGSSCHDASSPQQGMDLSSKSGTYTNWVGVDANEVALKRVESGNADDSYVIHKLEGTQAVGDRMPLSGCCLSQNTIDEIRAWIDAGAANN